MADLRSAPMSAKERAKRGMAHGGAMPKLPPMVEECNENGWEGALVVTPAVHLNQKGKRKPAVPWRETSIKSNRVCEMTSKPVLIDGLTHWTSNSSPDYGMFDKNVSILTYTDEEYELYLQEPTWTREQTDRLFEMCERFGLRFVAIHDRFTCPGPSDPEGAELLRQEEEELGRAVVPPLPLPPPASERPPLGLTVDTTPAPQLLQQPPQPPPQQPQQHSDVILSREKTIEDLKDRYYSIQKALLNARNSSDPELQRELLFAASFDPEYETQRKIQLSRLLLRTKQQVSRMAELVLEHRRLTHGIKTMKRNAKNGGFAQGGLTALLGGRKGAALAKAASGSAPIPEGCKVVDMVKPPPTGCSLRSHQLAQSLNVQGRNTAKGLETELQALHFKDKEPFGKLFDQQVCETYDKLRTDIVTFVNLQQHVAKRNTLRTDLLAARAQAELRKQGVKKELKRPLDDASAGAANADKRRRVA